MGGGKRVLLSAPKTSSDGEVSQNFGAGNQERFLAGGEPARGEPCARILSGEGAIKIEGHDGIIELAKGRLCFFKAAEKFLNLPSRP